MAPRWQDTHLRLMAELPVRTYTKDAPAPAIDTLAPRRGGRPSTSLTARRRARIIAMRKEGVSERDMAVRLGISRTAVQKHLRAMTGKP